MKIIKLLALVFSLTSYAYSQNTIGVKSYKKIENNDGIYFEVITSSGENVLLKASEYMDTGYSIYANDTFCLVLSTIVDQKKCSISASFKIDESWLQDYENIVLCYPDTGISTTILNEVSILDGTSLVRFW